MPRRKPAPNEVKSTTGQISQRDVRLAKETVLTYLAQGYTSRQAMGAVGRERRTFETWRRNDPDFKERSNNAKKAAKKTNAYEVFDGDFFEFSKVMLDKPLPPHSWPWVEALEDERNQTVLILVPPYHAKTSIISVHWAAYQLAKDRTWRGCRISETQAYAKKIVRNITHVLNDRPLYPGMERFRPFRNEFSENNDAWRQDAFYVLGAGTEYHSPSIEAKGSGSQIYGDRFHEIVCDDITSVGSNSPNNREKVKDIIRQDMLTRIPDKGKLIVIGTRVGSPDVYSELETESFFDVVIKQRALDAEGKALWPVVWPRHKLEQRRRQVGPRLWALQYQQTPAADDSAPFPLKIVEEAQENGYSLQSALAFAREHNLIKVMGFDPALDGYCVALLYGIDRRPPHHRYLLDIWREKQLYDAMHAFFIEAVRFWKPARAVIEFNNFQRYMAQAIDVVREVRAVNCYIQPHQTNRNKYDENFGVISLPELFYQHLIHMPWGSVESRERFQPFIDELVSWRPHDRDILQDQVMAFWFAEIGARAALPAEHTIPVHRTRGSGSMPRFLAKQRWDIYDPTRDAELMGVS